MDNQIKPVIIVVAIMSCIAFASIYFLGANNPVEHVAEDIIEHEVVE